MARQSLKSPFGLMRFGHLFTPRPAMDGKSDPQFELTIEISTKQQKTERMKALQQAVIDCATDKWGEKYKSLNLRFPFRKGSDTTINGVDPDAIIIKAKTKTKPGLIDREGNEILIPDEVWDGQVVQAEIVPFAYDVNGNRGVSFLLNNVQIAVSDAKRLDGRKTAAQAFADTEIPDDIAEQAGAEPASSVPASSAGGSEDAMTSLMS